MMFMLAHLTAMRWAEEAQTKRIVMCDEQQLRLTPHVSRVQVIHLTRCFRLVKDHRMQLLNVEKHRSKGHFIQTSLTYFWEYPAML